MRSSPGSSRIARSETAATVTLLWSWTRREFRARYLRSSLATAWAIVQPFAQISIYVVIFGVILRQRDDQIPYVSYVLAGMILFRPMASAFGFSSCLVDNYNIISHASFSREVIPLSQMLGASVEMVVTVPSLILIAWFQDVRFGPMVVLAPFIMLSGTLLASGVCVVLSTIQVFVRDLQFIVVMLSQGVFFASPISYPIDHVPSWLKWMATVNPISVHIEALRDVALRRVWPDWPLLSLHVAFALVIFFGSIMHLRSIQHRIVDLG